MLTGIGKRLKESRKRAGLRQSELAGAIGVGISTISDWELEKRSPSIDMIDELASALSVAPEYLLGYGEAGAEGASFVLPENIRPMSSVVPQRIPLIGEIAAGAPILADQDYESYVDVDTPVKADFALTVRGDSMEPTYLNGDILYIRQQPEVHNGQIAVVLIDDSATLKHVYRSEKGITLVSDNPAYEPMFISFAEHDTIRILGIVVGFTRMYAANRR